MCGIVGIANRSGSVSRERIEKATLSLAHRGPDDSGSVILAVPGGGTIALGNRRLAIFDLSPAGHQPMQDAASGNWIVFNGEIYNFRELRHQLEQAGENFSSHSDTEVLLKAYGAWGQGCLARLDGMFAFAIWDTRLRKLFLARDPMGIKPLYYGRFGESFIFASEVRTLLETDLVPRNLDQAGLLNYLSFGSAYDPVTLVEGISSLRPGHCLSWSDGALQESEFWDPLVARNASSAESSKPRAVEQLRATILDAVRMQMASDVPVGVFLSGGIDSSSVVAMLSAQGITPQTFSVTFEEQGYSEGDYASLVSRTFGTNHHELLLSATETLHVIPAAIDAMDQPTMDGVNTYVISKKTREAGIKVALSGLGGDEMFAGYSTFRSLPKLERFASAWKHVPGKRAWSKLYSALTPSSDQRRKLQALIAGEEFHAYFLARMLFTPEQTRSLLRDLDERERARAWAFAEPLVRRLETLDAINRISYLEARCYMANTLLRDADAMSMARGLEIRVPLIDRKIAEQVFTMPGEWKFDGQTPKKLLVDACPQPLPPEIVHREKRGFTFPFEIWLRGEMRNEIETTLHHIGDGPLGRLLDGEMVWRVWLDFLARRTSWSRPWAIYVLQKWCERNSISN